MPNLWIVGILSPTPVLAVTGILRCDVLSPILRQLMALLTIGEAAAVCGMRSRSTFYRWLNDGMIAPYVVGSPGAWRIETHPEGCRPFVDYVTAILGSQGPHRRSEPPEPELEPAGDPFWADYARKSDDNEPPLRDGDYWENVAQMVSALAGEQYSAAEICDLSWWIPDCRAAVDNGYRWDDAKWAAGSAESLLEDDLDEGALPELIELADSALLPEEVQLRVEVAIAGLIPPRHD